MVTARFKYAYARLRRWLATPRGTFYAIVIVVAAGLCAWLASCVRAEVAS